jgi:hypothetical protein
MNVAGKLQSLKNIESNYLVFYPKKNVTTCDGFFRFSRDNCCYKSNYLTNEF